MTTSNLDEVRKEFKRAAQAVNDLPDWMRELANQRKTQVQNKKSDESLLKNAVPKIESKKRGARST